MPLPVLHTRGEVPPADLIRLYHRTELHWAAHMGEEVPLDFGVAVFNRGLPGVWDANRVLDAAVPRGASPAEVVGQAGRVFADRGVPSHGWVLNPAASPEQTGPLAEHLLRSGWRADPADILHLAGAPAGRVREAPGLTVIPARASFRHAREIAEMKAKARGGPQLAEAFMLHLDDPHFDALLALRDGRAVGYAGVLAVGEIGRVDQVYVAEGFRRQGVGRTMMSRVLESCARSQFRHVMLACHPDNAAAQALYGQLGFRRVGQIVDYRRTD